MKFEYRYLNPQATHLETGVVIHIQYDAQGPGVSFKVEDETRLALGEARVSKIFEALQQTIEDERNRSELQRLVSGPFAGNNSFVEIALELETSRKVTNRTLQSWLADPHRPSSRKCPAWAVKALKDYIEKEGGGNSVRARNQNVMEQIRERPGGHLRLLASNDSNKWAEQCIAREDAQRAKLVNASLSELPEILHNRISELERAREHDGAIISILLHTLRAVRKEGSLQEFAADMLEHVEANFELKHRVRVTADTLKQDEQNAEER